MPRPAALPDPLPGARMTGVAPREGNIERISDGIARRTDARACRIPPRVRLTSDTGVETNIRLMQTRRPLR
jgi:hypothetical protein